MENNGMQMEMGLLNNRRRIEALGNLRILPDDVICDHILTSLSSRDIARLACVSSVMYIFCNEEPLWMSLCLVSVTGHLQYKGSWKNTVLIQEKETKEKEVQNKPLHFDGFYSLFLYRRLYRCHTTLDGFFVDSGYVERKVDLGMQEFCTEYDAKKPVLLTGLADSWPARKLWSLEQLLLRYGDTSFKISQRSARKIKMKFKDYATYMKLQHDEDPLYIFDEKFEEVAPGLLNDYTVPHLFREDYFDVLDIDQRPPFRWFIVGPERSGASWHVDPALTSAWNTLLCGRKRWALYPPGKVPIGVTVHVDDEDGDVNIDTPSSLQWWLEYYPLLPDEDKPIECTQLPGETIYVPSGWWHCVLNLEPTVAVTQNFVNSANFEYVCLDMAPGYRHKGVCRAGLLALDDDDNYDDGVCEDVNETSDCAKNGLNLTEMSGSGKRLSTHCTGHKNSTVDADNCCHLWNRELSYEISFLSKFLEEERDHYNSVWCSSNCIGQREMREWLWKLWIARPGIRDLIWKGACLALNAGKWFECIGHICQFHKMPSPKGNEKLPVGTGSNPVYLIADNVIKIYVEGGLESSLYCLGTELEFYNLLCGVNSILKEHVPDILASGFIYFDSGSYSVVPWDGKGVPDVLTDNNVMIEKCEGYVSPYGLWSKSLYDCKKAALPNPNLVSSSKSQRIWPYVVTKRCNGQIFAELRELLSWEETLNLASFLGEKITNLHMLPLPKLENSVLTNIKQKFGSPSIKSLMEIDCADSANAAGWGIFLHTLAVRRKDARNCLTKWGDPIPSCLIDKVNEYLPDNFEELFAVFEGRNCSWIHSDIMDDNIYMEPMDSTADLDQSSNGTSCNGMVKKKENQLWNPSYLLDFSDLSMGDPILDLIPIHLDIFKGNTRLLKQLFSNYKLPLLRKGGSECILTDKAARFRRPSYRAMCYCILHEDNVLGAIFSIWEDLKIAKSWEEVEEEVWGVLNECVALC